MLRTIRSKFQIQEQRIIIKKVIMKSGKNITEDGCKVYIELISFFRDEPRKTKRIPTSVWVQPKNRNSKKGDGTVTNKDPEHIEKNSIINTGFSLYFVQLEEREQGTWNEALGLKDY
jgi:hypothetical protein